MKLQSINPTTEESIGEFELYTEEMVAQAVAKARKAFPGWKKTDISDREKIISNFLEILKEKKDESAELITREIGKPLIEAKREMHGAAVRTDWFLKEIRNFIQDEEIQFDEDNISGKVKFEPLGVAGLITPWNFPFAINVLKIIPALLAGNTAVFKPSELSTFCGLKTVEMLKEAGLPEGVLNIITGDGKTGQYLVSSKINIISLTGSSQTGKDVAVRAGGELKKTVLELGGSDPFIIFDDANFERALNAVLFGRFWDCGQVCTSAKRILVDRKIYDSFLEKFVEKVKALRVGNPMKEGTEIGPLVSKKQLETLEAQVKDAVDKGAKVLCGGKRLETKGYFYQPTVLTNITGDMLVAKEEVFGPVAPIFNFDSLEEAIKMANNSKYGLGASIWTEDQKKAEEVANRIESGLVWINDHCSPIPQAPKEGLKESGMGIEFSKYGVLEFCTMKTIVEVKDKTIKKPIWFPYYE